MMLFFSAILDKFEVKERKPVSNDLGECERCGSPLESYGHIGIECSNNECFKELASEAFKA